MWLLEQDIRDKMLAAEKAGVIPTVEQQQEFEARISDVSANDSERILTVAGSTAEISIEGILTQKPSFLARIFGGGNTTYAEIVSAIAAAEQNDFVENITLSIDSPGGSFYGLFEATDAISAAKKPTKTIFSNVGASAAFALGVQADEVVASNRAARIGSVGVVVSYSVYESEVEIASSAAPKKRPDVRTEEGKAIVREQLDEMHSLFVDAIASGRSVTSEKVNKDFGQGATLLANEALKRGMIDSINETNLKVVENSVSSTAASVPGKTILEAAKMSVMTVETFKAQHPDVFASAVQQGVTQGVAQGVANERDRVTAHLTMGKASGDMETAVKAVSDGEAMTATLQAQYMSAGMNRTDIENRAGDESGLTAADKAAAIKAAEGDSATVASLVESKLGITSEAK